MAEHNAGQRLHLQWRMVSLLLLGEVAHLRLGELDVLEVAFRHLRDGLLDLGGDSLKSAGDHLSNFSDNARMATSLRASTAARMVSTVSRTLASAALMALASIPRLSQRGMGILLYSPPVIPLRAVDRRRRAGVV